MKYYIQQLYNVLMGTKDEDSPYLYKVVVALLFTSFMVAFIIITAEFIYSNVRL